MTLGNVQEGQFVKLVGLSSFMEEQVNLDQCLDEIVTMAANILQAATCSIMLFREDDTSEGFRLRLFAKHGDLPPIAYTEAVKVNDGIAGKVAASGQALLVQDIRDTEYLALARRPDSPRKSFMCIPIVINRKVIGVLNVSNPVDGRAFDHNDLNLSVFVALLVGKSVQVRQLQNLLKSRFAQIAITRETHDIFTATLSPASIDAGRLVKVVAKTFYREMNKAGFSRDHIVSAASEIISLLSESLERHDRRIGKETD